MPSRNIQIRLRDGSTKSFPKGITGLEIAQHISVALARKVLAISVDNAVWDATRPIHRDATVQLLTWDDEAGKRVFWHSSAHLLAEALALLYPGIQFGTGPAIDRGFYYDVDFGQHHFDAGHFAQIERTMLELARKKSVYRRIDISKQQAIKHFETKGGRYKLELLEPLTDGQITYYYEQGALATGHVIRLCERNSKVKQFGEFGTQALFPCIRVQNLAAREVEVLVLLLGRP